MRLNKQQATILPLVVLPILGLLAAIVLLWNQYVFWTDIALLIGLYIPCSLGVTVGYHRMLTHQGFKAPEWLRGLFLVLGVMAFEGQPIVWTATHIKHHAHSDEEDDPHSPIHGFWHAHMGWLFERENFADPKEYAPHLLEDKTVLFVNKWTGFFMILSLVIPFAIGGWTGLIWGGLVRIFFTTHVTWSVNSVCHTFGKRAFETTDASRNEWVVGLLALGEGWHNNHHAFPQSAFHGLRWWQFDLSGLLIRGLEKVGLVWDVQRVSHEVEVAQRERSLKTQESIQALTTDLWKAVETAKAQLNTSFWAAVSPATEKWGEMKHQAEARLAEMQAALESASHYKKQKLQMWLIEAQQIIRNLQGALAIEAGMVSVSSSDEPSRQEP